MTKLYLPVMDNGLGMCQSDFLHSFLHAFAGLSVHVDRISDSHPGRARNRAAANFLASDCTHLLFIDTDIVFHKGHIDLLEESAEPLLGGIYCIKQEETRPCLQTLPGFVSAPATGLIEVKRTGTGFLRIAREVFEKLKRPEIQYWNHGRAEWDFFRSGVVNGEWLSEDWYFCDDARAAGFRVMVDARCQVQHEGKILYPIRKTQRLTLVPPGMTEHIESIFKGEYRMELDRPPRTVLDIGANIGGFTAWAKEQWPDAEVFAYEPHPDNAALFRLNTRQFQNVHFTPMGVREEYDKHILKEGENCGEHSYLHAVGIPIETTCLAAFSLPSCEFVKIDTEGCEREILRGLDLSATRAVALEYHGEGEADSISAMLADRGFTPTEHHRTAATRGVLKFKKNP